MPELPEVTTVLNQLKQCIYGKKIKHVAIYYDKIIQYPTVENFVTNLIGQTFQKFRRLGKNLIFELDDYVCIVHLRMEGKFFVGEKHKRTKHEHLIIEFEDSSVLSYHDTRKFGTFHLYQKNEKYKCLDNYGEDALAIDFHSFHKKISRKNTTIKQALLDQKVVAGVGNIYADEIIHAVKLHPTQNTKSISKQKYNMLYQAMVEILNKAILAGGTTIRSYTSTNAIDGLFQLQLNIHMQKQCRRCNSDVLKIKVAQRGTYICPKCQKIK